MVKSSGVDAFEKKQPSEYKENDISKIGLIEYLKNENLAPKER